MLNVRVPKRPVNAMKAAIEECRERREILGGVSVETLDAAMRWLYLNANETSEEGVVGEVNFVRDLVTAEAP